MNATQIESVVTHTIRREFGATMVGTASLTSEQVAALPRMPVTLAEVMRIAGENVRICNGVAMDTVVFLEAK